MIKNLEINAISRPFVDVLCNGISSNWLYDTGAEVSVISKNLFERLDKKHIRELKTNSRLTSASKSSLKIEGVYEMELKILNSVFKHPVYVCSNLNQNAILGIDAIAKANLTFNIRKREFQIDEVGGRRCHWSLYLLKRYPP